MHHLLIRIFQSRLLFVLAMTAIFYGLFLIPNSGQTHRIWNEINNLGHIGAILIVWVFVFNLFLRFTRLSTAQLFVIVITSTLVVAELIEIIQGWIGRDDEWQDVWDSGVGAILASSFYSLQVSKLPRWPRRALRVLALIALVIIPWPIWSSLADEAILRKQFPVLCNFSTPFEISRWRSSNAAIQRDDDVKSGQHYLAIDFHPGVYSTASLKYFYSDWHGYKHLILDVTNPDKHDLIVTLRLHDRLHRYHYFAFNDRFNRRLLIKPGRQRIEIAIDDVENAPSTRKMDLMHMEDLGIFTMHSKSYHHLYINKIALE